MSPTITPRPTLFITSPRLSRHVGLDLSLASETLQHTGSFKFRAAFNNAAQRQAAHLIATSSGNFGQALAYACQLHGKRCTVVMPHDASPAKVGAVRTYGADVDLGDTRSKTRLARLREPLAAFPDAETSRTLPNDSTVSGARARRAPRAFIPVSLVAGRHRVSVPAVSMTLFLWKAPVVDATDGAERLLTPFYDRSGESAFQRSADLATGLFP